MASTTGWTVCSARSKARWVMAAALPGPATRVTTPAASAALAWSMSNGRGPRRGRVSHHQDQRDAGHTGLGECGVGVGEAGAVGGGRGCHVPGCPVVRVRHRDGGGFVAGRGEGETPAGQPADEVDVAIAHQAEQMAGPLRDNVRDSRGHVALVRKRGCLVRQNFGAGTRHGFSHVPRLGARPR